MKNLAAVLAKLITVVKIIHGYATICLAESSLRKWSVEFFDASCCRSFAQDRRCHVQAAASDWPAYRGPNADGVVEDHGELLRDWPAEGSAQALVCSRPRRRQSDLFRTHDLRRSRHRSPRAIRRPTSSSASMKKLEGNSGASPILLRAKAKSTAPAFALRRPFIRTVSTPLLLHGQLYCFEL